MVKQLISDLDAILDISRDLRDNHPDPKKREEMIELIISFNKAVADEDIKELAAEMHKSINFTMANHHDPAKRAEVKAIRKKIANSMFGFMFRLS